MAVYTQCLRHVEAPRLRRGGSRIDFQDLDEAASAEI
jgi:hypothetical protein